MKSYSYFILFALLFTSFQVSAQCGSNATAKTVSNTPEMNIVEIAASSEDFSTLVAAVKAAGLVATLQSEGPFTVFHQQMLHFLNYQKGL